MAWGLPHFGGDSSRVHEQLGNVQSIQAAIRGAFAANLESGSVVTWGDQVYGGDSSQVHEQLRKVQSIQAATRAAELVIWYRYGI